jgi:hypothetical protein
LNPNGRWNQQEEAVHAPDDLPNVQFSDLDAILNNFEAGTTNLDDTLVEGDVFANFAYQDTDPVNLITNIDQDSQGSATSGYNTEDNSSSTQIRSNTIIFNPSTALNFDNIFVNPTIVIVNDPIEEPQASQTSQAKRGRPKLTDEQKAANKAERVAKKLSEPDAPPKKRAKK